MKFARYLEENVVVEWRRAYINYRGLKKLIKRVDQRYKARADLRLKRIPSQGGNSVRTFASLRNRRQGKQSSSGDETHSDTAASDAALIDDRARERGHVTFQGAHQRNPSKAEESLPAVSLDGTGLKLAWREDEEQTSADGSQDSTPSTSAVKVHPKEETHSTQRIESDDVEARAANTQPMTSFSSGSRQDRPGAKTSASKISIFSRSQHAPDSSSDQDEHRKKGKKHKRAAAQSLEETLAREFDHEERKFFSALDSELERIVAFYLAHERAMTKRFEMLARQLQELSEHRRAYKAKHALTESRTFGGRLANLVNIPHPAPSVPRTSTQLQREIGGKSSKGNADEDAADDVDLSSRQPVESKTGTSQGEETFDAGDQRRAEALAKAFNITGGTLTDVEDEQLRKENFAAAMSHNGERYRHARKQLKAALLEYYRGLEILKNYKVLNRTGFAKILKKFEKTTGVHIADVYYHGKVAPSVLVSSDVIDKLIKSTEETYTAYFEHGNRKRAIERLRINSNTTPGNEHFVSHYGSMTRTGFFLGITLCAFVGGFVNAYDPVKRASIPLWMELLRVYGAEFIPTVFALLFGLNLLVWHHTRINTVFIFEWDVRHSLDHHQYFEMPAFFLMLLSVAFWVSFLNPFPHAIAPTTWPLVWLVVVLVVLLNPLPIFHYHSRKWLITSLGRVMHGGLLSGVEFRDFFLGDELNSMAWPLSSIWLLGCEYDHKWSIPNRCDPNGTFWTAILLTLPAISRLLQCFRRYHDSEYTANLHMVNAGKYAMTVLNYWFYINYRYHGSQRAQDLALWCVFGTIYAIYASAWDILMDWSLLQRRGKYPYLRESLVYEDYWPIYYFAMVTNVILRFGWVIYLIPGPATNLTRIFLIALLEALRRFQWNFFRLENEHLGNVDMYRVSREVPLPYTVPKRGTDADSGDEDERDNGSWPIVLRALTRLSGQGKGSRTPSPSRGHEANGKAAPRDDAEEDQDRGRSSSLGKQRASDVHDAVDSAAQGARARMERGGSLLESIKNVLVPDQGGLMAAGSRLTDIGAAKGAVGRDYQPRSIEGDAEVDSTTSPSGSEAGDADDSEVDENAAPTEIEEGDKAT